MYQSDNCKDCSAHSVTTMIARFMGPTWGPPGTNRTQVGPMLAPWSLLSRHSSMHSRWWELCERYIPRQTAWPWANEKINFPGILIHIQEDSSKAVLLALSCHNGNRESLYWQGCLFISYHICPTWLTGCGVGPGVVVGMVEWRWVLINV